MVKKIRFTIDSNGEVHLDVQGTVGRECEGFAQPFEDKLGLVSSRELKDTFFASETNDSVQTTSGELHD